ncbi:MAG: M28 family peptidase [Gemmatimonadetes bacterium]|nr:M28 family peptidase [Gemmatimonadota bacterium]
MSRTGWLLLVGTLVSGCAGRGPSEQEFDGAAAFGYIDTQLSFGPRVPNTEGHRRAGDWILERLRGTADSVEEQAFEHVTVDGDTVRLRNLIGRFRPDVADRILYMAHWDTRPVADRAANLAEQRQPVPGANDGGSGVALLLGVADALALTPPQFGVDLVFVDGEDYGDFSDPELRDVLIGARYYANNLDEGAPLPLFAVVWDMVADRDLRIPQESYSLANAPEVVQRVWGTARDLGYRRVFVAEAGGGITDDHVPLQQVGIRAIDVIDLDYGPNRAYWHTLQDVIENVSAESLQIVGDVAMALLR